MRRISFTPDKLQAIEAPEPWPSGKVRQVEYVDESFPGFGLRISSQRTRTWVLVKRIGSQVRRYSLGRAPKEKGAPGLTLLEARAMATSYLSAIAAGTEPRPEKAPVVPARATPLAAPLEAVPVAKDSRPTVREAARVFLDSHVKNLRRAKDAERVILKYAVPLIGDKVMHELTRGDISAMLDRVQEDRRSICVADQTLVAMRAMFNWWHEHQDETFRFTIGTKMRRAKPNRRQHALKDPEIAAVWNKLGSDVFGSLMKVLFLTAQRRTEVALMRWSDLDLEERVWSIPSDSYKTKRVQVVPLTDEVVAIIKSQQKYSGCPYVFTTNGRSGFQGFSKKKAELDVAVGAGVRPWVIHDVRRTGRTLLTRAGVSEEIAERVLGHVQTGIVGNYNVHDYVPEERVALQKLSDALRNIVGQCAENQALAA